MDALLDSYKKTGSLHHGYLFSGEKAPIIQRLHNFFEKHLKFPTRGNPDFVNRDAVTFSIDDARDIGTIHVSKALADRRIFLVSFSFITIEAQNALLKILEEPHQANHFFIIVPTVDILLPTVLSRLVHIRPEGQSEEAEEATGSLASKFLKMPLKKRLETAKELVDDKEEAIRLVKALQIANRKDPAKLEMLLTSSEFLYQRAASVKMVIENIALSL